MIEPALYIVGTPIGNLGDITHRAIETLSAAQLIVAEDTRHTRKLLTHFDIHTECMSCHRFNETSRIDLILNRIRGGDVVALVSDGGMPTISDPGSRLVAACHEAGVLVTSAPGPTAVTTAVALSGWGEFGFAFIGFLPRKPGKIRKTLRRWETCEIPVVIYESPYRALKLLNFIEEIYGAERQIFFVREITKKFEEMHTGTPAELRSAYEKRDVKGECVIIIAPATEAEQEEEPESFGPPR